MSTTETRRSLLMTSAISVLGVSGCASSKSGQRDDQQFIVERSREWTAAYVTGDTQVMEQILAQDFISTDPEGRRSGKAAAIAFARSGLAVFLSAQPCFA